MNSPLSSWGWLLSTALSIANNKFQEKIKINPEDKWNIQTASDEGARLLEVQE